jgi:DNA-binding NarL/FixJ family response regulator
MDSAKITLTERQSAVLKLIAQGRTAGQAAAEMKVTHNTVRDHLRSIFSKLNAVNSAHAVYLAMRRKLI